MKLKQVLEHFFSKEKGKYNFRYNWNYKLTTMYILQTEILLTSDIIQLMKLWRALFKPWNEISIWRFPCSVHEFQIEKNLRINDPVYIKEVRQRGKTTASHCFTHKIPFSAENFSNSLTLYNMQIMSIT